MDNMINFGIDLGTTNSLIARYSKGNVEVFKNPIGFKDTLPSVVGFRKERILVGEQARSFAEKDPKSVVSRFKRQMGTTESFKIKSLNQSKDAIELSAFVLKELKAFVYTGEQVDAAVITIPASFDVVQSNATKEAGHQAGFKQVILLQEPFAASLAYANKSKDRDLKNSQWLVYDLGGGTFDVALVKISDGELKILDHEGDNFLGGTDFDAAIVEKIVVPRLSEKGSFDDLANQLKAESGKHNALWHVLLHRAEEAKVQLSSKTSAEVLVEIEDDTGEKIDVEITITRSEFDAIIKSQIDRTADMVRKILTRNSLRSSDLQFILMVGGSTFIPYVRQRIGELLQIPVNCEIDPITAIAVGAAHFSATRVKQIETTDNSKERRAGPTLRMSYNRMSQETEELFAAKVEGGAAGLFYRITRGDGGFDSGIKTLTSRITEDLPLQKDIFNIFTIQILDQHQNPIDVGIDPIQIAQGRYSVVGQMVPHDICLVVDDLAFERGGLKPLLPKNTILPAKTKTTVTANRDVVKGSKDDVLRIVVVEGPSDALPEANLIIGELRISGKQIDADLFKGTDIELSVEMTESRDLQVSAYISAIEQEFKAIFRPTKREVKVELLAAQIQKLYAKIAEEKEAAEKNENFEVAGQLQKLQKAARELDDEAVMLPPDVVPDEKFKLEDRKRKLAQDVDALTKGKKLDVLRVEYRNVKEDCEKIVSENGNDKERRVLRDLSQMEVAMLSTENPQKIEKAISELSQLRFQVLRRTPSFLVEWFQWLESQRQRLNNQIQAKSLIDAGKMAIREENYDRLLEINSGLVNLLPYDEKKEGANKWGVGIT